VSQSITRAAPLQDEAATRPDLTVVIVSWNVRDHLLRCLAALSSEDVRGKLDIEIIIVDNASTDGTLETLHEWPMRVIANNTNLGYGRANNMGLSAARGRHMLVLNPDTLPQPGSIPSLFRFAAMHHESGIVAPRLLNPDGSVQPASFSFPSLPMAAIDLFPLPDFIPGRFRSWLVHSPLNGRHRGEGRRKKPFRIDHPLGACFLIRRGAYEECGGFDERIFMYSEEIDLAIRYAQAGWECWQVPAARVVHLGGQSTSQLPARMFMELWRSRLYIYSKYYPQTERVALELLLRAAMWRDIALVSMKGLLGTRTADDKSKARRARAVLRMLSQR
jgi:N-acetylglucosaminyl-diphospho-decaprenol L-rhamnosyltransferase